MQIRVCFESATAVADPSSRPARRSARERNGMMITLSAVMTMPSGAVLDLDPAESAISDVTVT